MAYGTVNADVIGTSVAGSNLGAGNASIMKNRIINGAMVINQRGWNGTVSSGNNQYTLDRWNAIYGNGGWFSVAQSSTVPAGFVSSLLVTSTGANTADIDTITQNIEGYNIADLGWGTVNAKTVTLSFWARSSLTGTFGGSLQNSAKNRSYPFSYSLPTANTWTQISVTIAGDTSGTWLTDNSTGIQLNISLGCNSTFSGTAGSWAGADYRSATGATSVVGTNGATFYITGVQLEVGSSATGFEYVNYQTSLANCQRYYIQYGPYGSQNNNKFGSGIVDSASQATLSIPCVPMRATPSVTYGAAQIYDSSVVPTITSVLAINILGSSINVSFGASAGTLTQARACNIRLSTTTEAVTFSAEL
jgi:hypothetical protein